MKKTNTAIRKGQATKKRLTVGIDVGDRSSRYCVLDEQGDVIFEGSFPTTKAGMDQVFGSMAKCRMAMETGCHSPWVSRQLSQLGHEVVVCECAKCPADRREHTERRSSGRSNLGAVGAN